LASIECGYQSHDELVLEGPMLWVVISNRSATVPLNKQLQAFLDTGSEWSLIEDTLATAVLHLMHIDDQLIQTANGPALAAVYLGQLTIPNLTYSKLQRFIGVDLGADRVILGREVLQDFLLTYLGRSGKVTLEY
jgi:gag-polyprotein putative aspartyl protease